MSRLNARCLPIHGYDHVYISSYKQRGIGTLVYICYLFLMLACIKSAIVDLGFVVSFLLAV